MDEDDPDMLFKRYFRGENTMGQAGTGIGLYMARTLARLQGGDIELGQGCPGFITFTLCLPCVAASCAAVDQSEKMESLT